MATNPDTGGIRAVTPSPGITPLRAGIVLSASEARKIAEALVTIEQVAGRVGIHLIDKLDVMEGDPDLETERLEDDFTPMPAGIDYGPGCPVTDAPEEDDHGGGDVNDEPHDAHDEDGI